MAGVDPLEVRPPAVDLDVQASWSAGRTSGMAMAWQIGRDKSPGGGIAQQRVDVVQMLAEQVVEQRVLALEWSSPNHQNQSLPSAMYISSQARASCSGVLSPALLGRTRNSPGLDAAGPRPRLSSGWPIQMAKLC